MIKMGQYNHPSIVQAYLGGRAGDMGDILSRYAISSIPTYILAGSDVKLMYRGDNLEEITKVLRRELP